MHTTLEFYLELLMSLKLFIINPKLGAGNVGKSQPLLFAEYLPHACYHL